MEKENIDITKIGIFSRKELILKKENMER
jgi:hypothetical protein